MEGFAVANLTFLVAFLAGWFPRTLPSLKQNGFLTAIAAGLLLASVLMVVLPEGFELFFQESDLAPIHAGLAILGGFLLMLAIELASPPKEKPGAVLVTGLSLHALVDGLALGSALAVGGLPLQVALLLAIFVHKIPVAFALGTFLWHGSVSRPLLKLIAFSLATPLGLLLTASLHERLSGLGLSFALLFSGGTFLYVAVMDVFLQVGRRPAPIFFWGTLLGTVVIMALQELHGGEPELR